MRLLLIFIITNNCTINIIQVYIKATYKLYSYTFRHFHVIISEFTSAPRQVTEVIQIVAAESLVPLDGVSALLGT